MASNDDTRKWWFRGEFYEIRTYVKKTICWIVGCQKDPGKWWGGIEHDGVHWHEQEFLKRRNKWLVMWKYSFAFFRNAYRTVCYNTVMNGMWCRYLRQHFSTRRTLCEAGGVKEEHIWKKSERNMRYDRRARETEQFCEWHVLWLNTNGGIWSRWDVAILAAFETAVGFIGWEEQLQCHFWKENIK